MKTASKSFTDWAKTIDLKPHRGHLMIIAAAFVAGHCAGIENENQWQKSLLKINPKTFLK